jgi:small subunit ribosomal protein S6
MVIVDPDLSSEKRDPLLERMEETISQQGGMLISCDDWGTRKLAYEIKKKSRGHYLRLDYCGNGELVSELERFYRIDDRVMKYMTVLLEKEADIEAIKAEMAKAEEPEEPEESEESDADETASAQEDTKTPETPEEK